LAFDESIARAAFNRAADSIETTAVQNPVNAWMRKASRRELLATFPAGAALLEVGCGTGPDAVFLAERGYRVAALDISDRMVELARDRVAARDLERNVVVWRGRLCDVETELATSPWLPFDGAYANFSLAYEDSLRGVAQIVSALVKPGAWFVFSLPNKFCVSEPAVAFARLHFWEVLRRFREPRWATIRGSSLRVHAYTPGEVRRILRGFFAVGSIAGLPVFMPPPYLFHSAFERLWKTLELFDDRLAARFPWRSLGESTLFKVQRVGA